MATTFNNIQLALDVKAQDRLRKWFADRGSAANLIITSVGLGDSDVDYELSQQYTRIKVLNAPYNVGKIKHHLIYEGPVENITGDITMFLRRVNDSGVVESLYNYPPDNINFAAGIAPPTLSTGYDFSTINFDILNSNKEGFIVYFQTLPTGYLDSSNVQQRLSEQYDFTFLNFPGSWEIILDQENSSFLIAKPAAYVFTGNTALIKLKGQTSSIQRTIGVNI